jgi:L-ectoine synthase
MGMKIISVDEIKWSPRVVECPKGGFISHRLLLAKDGMGFSVHITEVPAGPPQHWHYKNHLEACYCVSGEGELVNLETGEAFIILPGTLYALDQHDNHTFQALSDVVLVSIFNPPVTGTEVHDKDGSYGL